MKDLITKNINGIVITLDDDYVVYIIKGGHKDTYFVIHDDAHSMFTGKTEIFTSANIKEKYGIDIEEKLKN